MAREVDKLTAMSVAKMSKKGDYRDGWGLVLQVGSKTQKSWRFDFTLRGRARQMGLGSAATFSLKEARDAARQARQLVHAGIDPIEARKAEKQKAALAAARSIAFKEACQRFIESQSAGWGKTHAFNVKRMFEMYAYPVIGSMAVDMVDDAAARRVLSAIWEQKPDTGSRLRGHCEGVLDYGRVQGWRSGENPFKWKGNLEHVFLPPTEIAPVKHHPSMPFEEIPDFMKRLRTIDRIEARALEFLILCGNRTGEVVGAEWREVDFNKQVWTVPGARFKSRRDFEVPLTGRALDILVVLHENRSRFVFPSPYALSDRPIAQDALRNFLNLTLGVSSKHAVVHGFRASLRSWLGEMTDCPKDVAEACIGHAIGDALVTAYHRAGFLQRRKRYLGMWSCFCMGISMPGEVVTLRAASP